LTQQIERKPPPPLSWPWRMVQVTVTIITIAVLGGAIVNLWLGYLAGDVQAGRGLTYLGSDRIQVWLDPETGCEYVMRGGTFTPRMQADGRQVCNGKEGPNAER